MTQSPAGRGRRWTLWFVALATVLALLVVFVAENFVVVELRFFGGQYEVRLAWAVLIAGLVGVVVGLVLPRPWR